MRSVLLMLALVFVASCDKGRPSQDAPTAPRSAAAGSLSPVASTGQVEATSVSATEQDLLIPPPPPPPSVGSGEVAETKLSSTSTNSPSRVYESAPTYTPAPGSPERKALMDALRPVVRPEIGGEVTFVINKLKSNGQWAFGVMEPQWPDGRKIDLARTPVARQYGVDALDGLRTEAIWQKTNGRWSVVAHGIGATDVWWATYCGRVPKSVLGC